MQTVEIKRFKFHKSFVNAYRGLDIIQVKRKLKGWYTHSEKDAIVKYLKENGIIKH